MSTSELTARWRACGPPGRPTERVYLVGFMGSGKSLLGRLLAERLGWRFADLDALVEAAAGARVREIFESLGEARFRELEHEALQDVSGEAGRAVVALGGGAFCAEPNRAIVRGTGVSVWVDVPFPTLARRVVGDPRRPLARTREGLEALYRARLPFYREADVRLRPGGAPAEEVARGLVALLRSDWRVPAGPREPSR